MPNFWSTTTQKIYECLYGPRTRDTEFDQKVEELNAMIALIKQIKETITHFPSRTSGIQKTCHDLYSNLSACYSDNNIYSEFIRDVCDAHRNIENAYNSCAQTIGALSQMSTEWDKQYNEVQENLKRREEAREIYDHYDKKMEELVKNRNEKLSRHQSEAPKDIEKFDRNDGKYKRAANDLIQLSNYTYKLMQELIDYRYRMLNPLLTTFLTEEKKFFDSCSNFFRKFDNINMKLNALERGFQKTPIQYDPTKHIRATRLLVGVNMNDLPKVTRKDKYTYEDYKTRAKTNTIMSNDAFVNGTSNPVNNNNNNQFSYESYLKRSTFQTTDLNPPKSNQSTSNNNISNPFSYEAYKAKTQSLTKSNTFEEFNKPSNTNTYQNPYSFDNNKANNNDPFSNFNSNQKLSQSYMIDTKPTNNYDFGLDSNKDFTNPYASINFNSPSTSNNPFPDNNRQNNFGGNNMFVPSGNDYLKFSNIGGDNNQRGGNNDFPK